MNIVRQSKYRHVFCKPVRTEQCLQDVRVTEITWESLFAAASAKFMAFIVKGSGGPFMVFPLKKFGRIGGDHPLVEAHKGPCLELAWSPFNDHVIASCSEDATAKVWLIPEKGLVRNLKEPVVELDGHQKRVNTIVWHPVANNILLTAGGDNKILIWNVGTGEALIEIAGHPDQIWSVGFNYDGSKFVTTCKDKLIRVIDPRSGAVLQQGQGHDGVKPQKAIFLKDGRIFTTGFTKRSERLYALRSEENLGEPIVQEDLDTSNGVLFPLYDEDTGLIYLAGKGDSAIRYYEVNDEAPFVHYINTYTTSEPQRAIAFCPKRALDHTDNEIARIYKLRTSGVVDIMQFYVPRKSDLFQHDIFPLTRGTQPTLSPEQWMEGTNAPPTLVAVCPEASQEAKPKTTVAKKANILAQMPPQTQEPSSVSQRPVQNKMVIDEDSGIVPVAQKKEQQNKEEEPTKITREGPIGPGKQAQLKSRADRDSAAGATTAGQKRAAAELERIKRDKERTVHETVAAADESRPPPAAGAQQRASRGGSTSSTFADSPSNLEEMASDMQKLKAILRQHERRIRLLEDQLADANMTEVWNM